MYNSCSDRTRWLRDLDEDKDQGECGDEQICKKTGTSDCQKSAEVTGGEVDECRRSEVSCWGDGMTTVRWRSDREMIDDNKKSREGWQQLETGVSVFLLCTWFPGLGAQGSPACGTVFVVPLPGVQVFWIMLGALYTLLSVSNREVKVKIQRYNTGMRAVRKMLL